MADFTFAGRRVKPATRQQVQLPAGRLPSGTELSLAIEVLHGADQGPVLWLSGAIHGDEIVGVEIIRRVLERLDARRLSGTIIAVPVVNVFGFVTGSRYLPDHRDLNRSFPGSVRGPLASRLARLFVDQVVTVSDIGIDFHAGSDDRTNLPQVRGNMDHAETARLGLAFGAPLVVHSKTIKGTLRDLAVKRGKTILLFEGGEPRRFSEQAVEVGVAGTLRSLEALGMGGAIGGIPEEPATAPTVSRSTTWVRASRGGIFRLETELGSYVTKGGRIGMIADPSGRGGSEVRARSTGVVMGHSVNPLVHQGDALVHIAEFA